jgi:hypothetical protein
MRVDASYPNIVRGGTHGQCRLRELGCSSRKTLAGTPLPRARWPRIAGRSRGPERRSGGSGEAATPTSGVEGPNQAPRNRSEAEVPRVQWSFLGGLR